MIEEASTLAQQHGLRAYDAVRRIVGAHPSLDAVLHEGADGFQKVIGRLGRSPFRGNHCPDVIGL
jgi:hypothetical protein